MLRIIHGDATVPLGKGDKWILHSCNTIGAWGKGFVLALDGRWSSPREEYQDLAERSNRNIPLGSIQRIQVNADTYVINAICQYGLRSAKNPVPFQVDVFDKVLQRVVEQLLDEYSSPKEFSIHMPYGIGCGLGGGCITDVHRVIGKYTDLVDIYLYQLVL